MKLINIRRFVVSLLFVVTLVGGSADTCYASKKEPTKKSNCINLSQSGASMSFQVDSLKNGGLYTNCTFTGAKNVKISIGEITVDMNGSESPVEDLKIQTRLVASDGFEVNQYLSAPVGGVLYIYGLDKSKKYFLAFSKTNDGQIYSFSGDVKKN